jgi:dodecin
MATLDTQGTAQTDSADGALFPTYRLTEIVGTSAGSVDEAISNGIERASHTLHGLDWFQVVEIRGSLQDGHIAQTQVTMKVGFRVDD